MEWQPIETAPRDANVHIMIYVPATYNHEYFIVRWNPYEFGGIWQIGSSLAVIGKDMPTHWMPLPKPPTTDVEVG